MTAKPSTGKSPPTISGPTRSDLNTIPTHERNRMQPLPHLATRIFDTPLLIAPQKLEVILGVLAPRLGLDVPPSAVAVTASERAQRKSYEVTPEGIAIVPIEGTLVHKSYGIDALSGLRSYTDVQAEMDDAATDP